MPMAERWHVSLTWLMALKRFYFRCEKLGRIFFSSEEKMGGPDPQPNLTTYRHGDAIDFDFGLDLIVGGEEMRAQGDGFAGFGGDDVAIDGVRQRGRVRTASRMRT